MLDPQFDGVYAGRKVLITGHTGFKGSWLSLWLQALGAKVIGYSLPPPTQPSNYELTRLEEKITSVTGDVRDADLLMKVVAEQKPEIVFHLAAQPLVREGYEDPRLTYETNIMGLVNLFEAVRASNSVRALLVVTSDKCYENKEWVWGYRESDELGGHDPYSSSKACAEVIAAAYRRSFFAAGTRKVPISSARAGNVIGGGDWAKDRIVPDCVRALAMGKKIRIRNPFAVRPWQHVLEPLSGYLWLASNLILQGEEYAGAWNFGPKNGHGMAVEGLVRSLVEIWGAGRGYECVRPEKDFHESNYLQLDCSKACRKLGWWPVLDVDEAVRWTVDWYKRHYIENEHAYDLCMENILAYSELAGERSLKWASCQPVQV
ncbi:MAG: CDP-glucose 4,6-dehydratase [bacterium]